MLRPMRVFALLWLAASVACGGADKTRRQSTSSPPAASTTPAAAAAARGRGTLPTDSISERADSGRIRGHSQAKLWIVEASDFPCPYCKMWHDSTYGPLVREYVES